MTGLLGPNGQPITSAVENKKAPAPTTGYAFGHWAGRDLQYAALPGGGLVQFDLSKLTLDDYRSMRDHYQINASLAVLSFMQHQSDWHIESDNKKIQTFCDEQMRNNWTQINKGMATANWAGYSPNVLNWENDIPNRAMILDKVLDLVPEECRVEWKEVEGWAPPGRIPPKFRVYDGIKQFGMGWPIPGENTFWYSLLMQNGDYYGTKLLRPTFPSWYFSILVHLFANRYYERFGEPTPIGRAPFDEEIDVAGESVQGNQYMLNVLSQLRSRSVVVLPNDKSQVGAGTNMEYDYALEYLESQMRGADFERYLTRLDEEISIGLFTPILLLRTADVGSYNLGVGHMQMYLWMLNAMNDDRAEYLNSFILRRMVDYNFGVNAPDAKIVFRKLGNTNSDMLKELLVALIQGNKADVDLVELGQMAGLTLSEVKQTLAPESPAPAPAPGEGGDGSGDGATPPPVGDTTEARSTAKEIVARVRPQIERAFRDATFGPDMQLNMGYKRKMEKSLESHGFQNPVTATNDLYGRMDNWVADVLTIDPEEFSGPDSFMSLFTRVLDNEITELSHAK